MAETVPHLPLDVVGHIFSYVSDHKTVGALRDIGETSSYLAEKYCCTKISHVTLSVHSLDRGCRISSNTTHDRFLRHTWRQDSLNWFSFLMRNARILKKLKLQFHLVHCQFLLTQAELEKLQNWMQQLFDCLHPHTSLVSLEILFPHSHYFKSMDWISQFTSVLKKVGNLKELTLESSEIRKQDTEDLENNPWMILARTICSMDNLKKITINGCSIDWELCHLEIGGLHIAQHHNDALAFLLKLKKAAPNGMLAVENFQKLKMKQCYRKGVIEQFPRVKELEIRGLRKGLKLDLNSRLHKSVRAEFFRSAEVDFAVRNLNFNIIADESFTSIQQIVQKYNSDEVVEPDGEFDSCSILHPIDFEAVMRSTWIENLCVVRRGNASICVNIQCVLH